MNLRFLRIAAYLGRFFLVTIPKRARLHKLMETDPQEAFRLVHEDVKKVAADIIKITGSTVTVNGLENIPEGNCLFAGNHMSLFDVIVAEYAIPNGAGFVAKDSLEKIPGLADWMSLMLCLFLNRKDTKEGLKIIFKGADYLKDGFNMVIFPEGTRCKEGQLGEFKGASLKMAQKAKVPVVPFALTGTPDVFENNKGYTVKPANVTITFGQPLLINALPRPEQRNAVDMVKQTISDMIDQEKAV